MKRTIHRITYLRTRYFRQNKILIPGASPTLRILITLLEAEEINMHEHKELCE